MAWSNGVDAAIDSLKYEIDRFYPKLFSVTKDSVNVKSQDFFNELSLHELNPRKIDQDIDILSLNLNQLKF